MAELVQGVRLRSTLTPFPDLRKEAWVRVSLLSFFGLVVFLCLSQPGGLAPFLIFAPSPWHGQGFVGQFAWFTERQTGVNADICYCTAQIYGPAIYYIKGLGQFYFMIKNIVVLCSIRSYSGHLDRPRYISPGSRSHPTHKTKTDLEYISDLICISVLM